MKFIQVREGLSVRKEDIESVEKINDLKSKIVTRFNEYEVNFPYKTILSILEMEGIEERMTENLQSSKTDILLQKIINNQPPGQYFAG